MTTPPGRATRPAATTRCMANTTGTPTRPAAQRAAATPPGATTRPAASTRCRSTPPGTATRPSATRAVRQHHRELQHGHRLPARCMNNTTGSNNIAIGYHAALNVSGWQQQQHSHRQRRAPPATAASSASGRGHPDEHLHRGHLRRNPEHPQLAGLHRRERDSWEPAGCSSTPSSRRFKEQIADMGDSSSKLLQLRPVTFLYKPQYDDGSHAAAIRPHRRRSRQVYPDMVGYDKDGQPSSVKYQSLAPMLLNEVQKQNAQLQNQNGKSDRVSRSSFGSQQEAESEAGRSPCRAGGAAVQPDIDGCATREQPVKA